MSCYNCGVKGHWAAACPQKKGSAHNATFSGGGFNTMKAYKGKVYTGMSIGSSHKWSYSDTEWKEADSTSGGATVDFAFDAVKTREKNAPKNSGAKVDTQYHWYLVADMVLQAADDGQLRFTLSGDKFKVGHKRPDKPWSYAYKKRQGPLHARKRFLVESLELLKSQQQELAQRMAADAKTTPPTKQDKPGSLDLLGCPDANALSIANKVAGLCDLGPINWSTVATKWKETKKTPERWWVEITGLLRAPSKKLTAQQLATLHNSHFLLVADQVAAKLDANRYHTVMRGFKVPLGLGCVAPTMDTTVRLCSHLQVVKEALLSNLIKQGPPLACAAEQAMQAKVDATQLKKLQQQGTPTIKGFLQQKKQKRSAPDAAPMNKKTKTLAGDVNTLTFGATLSPSSAMLGSGVAVKIEPQAPCLVGNA